MANLVRLLFFLMVVAAIAACGVASVTIWYFGRNLPDYQQLAHYQPPITTRVQAGDGRLLAEYATQRRVFVPIRVIPKLVRDAFIAAEDKNFYTNHGVEPLSILRAAVTDLIRWRQHRRPIGASTITQQVAKNMLLNNELTASRKIKEILLATRLDAALPKDRILELYLNEIYLGDGAYGVGEAALTYFDKSLDQLTLGEAAFLGGLPKAPSNYDPVRFPEVARERRDWVIDRMVEDGFATAQQAAAAKAEAIAIRHREATETVHAPYFAEEVRRELLARYGDKMLYQAGLSVRTSVDPRLQAVADETLRAGLIDYDRTKGGWRGPVSHIAIAGDWRAPLAAVPLPAGAGSVGWQLAVVLRTEGSGATIGLASGAEGWIPFAEMRWARPLIDHSVLGAAPRRPADVVKPGDVVLVDRLSPAAGGKLAARGEGAALYNLVQIPDVSGALVVIDPHTGRVLAMTGGFSFQISQFNRATQAMRQPGSAIKPFVYLTALELGWTPSTMVLDEPISLSQGPGLPLWTPENYERNFRGPIPLRVALEHSVNVATARVAAIIGIDPIARNIERFGIMDHTPREYSMALGAGDTTPLRLTAAYAMLANGGKRIIPTLIDSVQDRDGTTIYRTDQRPCAGCSNVAWHHQPVPVIPDTREQIADPDSVFQDIQMMEQVVQHGTGVAVKAVGVPIAGKTGTTSDFHDAWFVGFTPNLVAGVYVGYDEPFSLGRGEQAAVVAAPIFRDFMIAALKYVPAIDFSIPPGMQMYRVSLATGLPASSGDPGIWEAYKPGTEPGGKERDLGLHHITGEVAEAAGEREDDGPEQVGSDQVDPDQGWPGQGGPGQGGPGQGGPDQGTPYQGAPYQGGPEQAGRYQDDPYQGGPEQAGPYQRGPYQRGPEQAGPMPYGPAPAEPGAAVSPGRPDRAYPANGTGGLY